MILGNRAFNFRDAELENSDCWEWSAPVEVGLDAGRQAIEFVSTGKDSLHLESVRLERVCKCGLSADLASAPTPHCSCYPAELVSPPAGGVKLASARSSSGKTSMIFVTPTRPAITSTRGCNPTSLMVPPRSLTVRNNSNRQP